MPMLFVDKLWRFDLFKFDNRNFSLEPPVERLKMASIIVKGLKGVEIIQRLDSKNSYQMQKSNYFCSFKELEENGFIWIKGKTNDS